MRTESVFEIHTSKLLSKFAGMYLLHSWREVREGKGEGETRAHIPRPFNAGINHLLRDAPLQ